MIIVGLGTLALGFDRQTARAMSQISGEFGEFCRQNKVWGTLARSPDPQASYRNFLFFIRFWGIVMASFGILLFLLGS